MPVNLSTGSNVSVTKEAPGLNKTAFGLGWSPRTTDGAFFDLDAVALVVHADNKTLGTGDFVFFKTSKALSVRSCITATTAKSWQRAIVR